MSKFEEKIVDIIIKNKNILFIVVVTMLGIIVRFFGRDKISSDMSTFLIPWYDCIKSAGGIKSLENQVGDYNILYQTIIACLTYLDVNPVYLYKSLSSLFDFVLAISGAYIISKGYKKKWNESAIFGLVYAAILFLPTVVLNSAFWGQCDSIYAVLIMWSVYFIYIDRPRRGFIILGIAFAFKLQSIFIVPVIIYLYFYKRNFSIIYSFYTVVVFWLSGIVGYINGRNLLDVFKIYQNQTGEYGMLYMNTPSFWSIFSSDKDYHLLMEFAIILTIVILGCGLLFLLEKKIRIDDLSNLLLLVSWTLWTSVIFLPGMHERYTYPLDVVLIMLAFANRRYIYIAVLEIVLSTIAYGSFLFGFGEVTILCSVINLVCWIVLTCGVVNRGRIVKDKE